MNKRRRTRELPISLSCLRLLLLPSNDTRLLLLLLSHISSIERGIRLSRCLWDARLDSRSLENSIVSLSPRPNCLLLLLLVDILYLILLYYLRLWRWYFFGDGPLTVDLNRTFYKTQMNHYLFPVDNVRGHLQNIV